MLDHVEHVHHRRVLGDHHFLEVLDVPADGFRLLALRRLSAYSRRDVTERNIANRDATSSDVKRDVTWRRKGWWVQVVGRVKWSEVEWNRVAENKFFVSEREGHTPHASDASDEARN